MSLILAAAVRSTKPKRNVAFVSTGLNCSFALQKNGRAWGWGSNGYGQLGDNSTTSRRTPVSVLGAVKTFCQINTGAAHFLAIDKYGRLWAWGLNGQGQLGDNSLISKRTPVSVLGAVKTFCKIAAGQVSTYAIDKNGRAWAWGYNAVGQLGDNSITSRLTPVSVLGAVKTFCQIAGARGTGNSFSLAIDKNGRAWGWGYNLQGQLGDNSITSRLTPVSVLGAVKTFCQINAGLGHSLAIDKYGRLWAWGTNGQGQLGDNSLISKRTPVSVLGAVKTFCKIAGGNSFSLAIDKNGRAWGWGYNIQGQLGDGTNTNRLTPVSVAGQIKTFCEIAADNQHVIAIDKNGRAWAWGADNFGQLGDGLNFRTIPVSVLGAVKTFCQISAGGGQSLAIDKNGRAWGWGGNGNGQIGDNSTTSRLTPVSVLGAVKTFCKISGGGGHSLAIDKNGRAWGWGYNGNGRIGDNSTTSRRTPVSVLGAVKTFCNISAGNGHSLAVDKNGRAWGWGNNSTGQIGDNSTISKITPVSVLGAVKTFCQIAACNNFSLAIDKNGRAWAWGNNGSAQLGDNSTISKITPISVLGAVKTFCKIAGGFAHSAAIDKNGRVWCWGFSLGGELGDNTTTQRLTPVSVVGTAKTFCQISAGAFYTLAIDKNGRAWAWGGNSAGYLGDGSATNRCTPVSVAGAVKTFCQISADGSFSVAMDKNGRAWAWGDNSIGLLGINARDDCANTPVQICNI